MAAKRDNRVTAHIVHHVPGRVRLRIPSLRGKAAYFDDLAAALALADGVRSASANALTGSVLIRFEGALDPVLEAASGLGLFDIDAAAGPHGGHLVRAPAALGAAVLGALGGMQFLRGQGLPAGVTLLWYAASLAARAGQGRERK
ncbi:MAG: hypothetical protein KIT16_07320 [Rhodospirillaceae bacterium]|nr:hypothetical protein [Rhodospirillaceae bacterium]